MVVIFSYSFPTLQSPDNATMHVSPHRSALVRALLLVKDITIWEMSRIKPCWMSLESFEIPTYTHLILVTNKGNLYIGSVL